MAPTAGPARQAARGADRRAAGSRARRRRRARSILVCGRRAKGDARGRQRVLQQGRFAAARSAREGSAVSLFLRRPQRAPAAGGTRGQSGVGRHRKLGGLHSNEPARRRRRGPDRSRARRRPHGHREGDRQRSGNRPRGAQDQHDEPADDHARPLRPVARGRRRARDRQPVRGRPDGHDGDHQRARAQPPRHQHVRELHPDRRADQPGQFGRRARRRKRQPARHQYGDLLALGRLARHRLRDPRVDRAQRARASSRRAPSRAAGSASSRRT